MSVGDLMPMMLLMVFSLALAIGFGTVLFVARQVRLRQESEVPHVRQPVSLHHVPNVRPLFLRRPECWLAIRCRSLLAVQSALGLYHTKRCSVIEGLVGDQRMFVAPALKGWTLVMGAGLPDPSEDVDACFRFLMGLSRKLGEVQFFSANRALNQHAWVRAERGHVLRAYAWAGRTLWKQGYRTAAERELDLKCFDYDELPERTCSGEPDVISVNTEKVPLLASRWSLDPGCMDEWFLEHQQGVAGDLSQRY